MVGRIVNLLCFVGMLAGIAISQDLKVKPTPPPIPKDGGTPIETELFNFTVSVRTKNLYLTNLKHEDFEVTVDKKKRPIAFFAKASSPVSIGILFDLSGSSEISKRKKINEIMLAVEGATDLINRSNPANEYFFLGFNDEIKQFLGPTSDIRKIRESLAEVIKAKPYGRTRFYDAVEKGISLLDKSKHNRRVLIIVSDGEDNSSERGFRKLKRIAGASGHLIYAVDMFSNTRDFRHDWNYDADKNLKRLVRYGGGTKFTPISRGGMRWVFRRIAIELNSQFLIGVLPDEIRKEKKWHQVKIRFKPGKKRSKELGKVFVKASRGFYY